MDAQTLNGIVSFIWGIADDCLRDVYVRGKYRDVILPMTVLRRLDVVLEKTKAEAIETKNLLDASGVSNKDEALCGVTKKTFYNVSPFTLRDLTARTSNQKLKADFIAYLDGFSPNVQEILEKFKFRNQIDTMVDADILHSVIEKFVDPSITLGVDPVADEKGRTLPGLDNHAMGTIFEELVRRFNEANNEEAGEHWTPRDVVELMADLVFTPVADKITDGTYLCYDGACGTGGMLTVAEDRLKELAKRAGKTVSIHLFGQEVNPETYAIANADMILKGESSNNIAYGSTLSADKFSAMEFDFMLSNPPYGKSWSAEVEKMGGSKKKEDILDVRFNVKLPDGTEVKALPKTSDGQLLFLLNNVDKMKKSTKLGSRIAEVHNGSSLFTGDAGQGESNARRFLIEHDYVEAIVALPEKMFYNTGITTYIWILSNKKEPRRRGKIQLIDATEMKSTLRKNMGEKNCEFTPEIRAEILRIFTEMEESDVSKIFDNREFGHWRIAVRQPEYDENGKPKRDKKGNLVPDKSKNDEEIVPFTYEGGIDAFMENEVRPYAPDAWVDDSKTSIGYELSFTKYFYKPVQLRPMEEIVDDLKKVEAETDGLLAEILEGLN